MRYMTAVGIKNFLPVNEPSMRTPALPEDNTDAEARGYRRHDGKYAV